MTFQDYLSLSQDSFSTFSSNFLPTFTNIIAATVAIGVGILIGWVLKRIVEQISSTLGVEKGLLNLPFYGKLSKSHDELDITTFVGEAVRWVAIGIFLISAVASLQIEGSEAVFSQIFGYTTNVVLASLYLLFGFVVAWFVHRAIMATAVVVGNNPPSLIANTAYLALVVFAAIQAFLQLGVTIELIRLFVIAVFLASALAAGLGGKETVGELIRKLVDKAK